MREPQLVEALTEYVTITGKDPERIFLTPDDWRKLGFDLYPFGPATIRMGLNSYSGLPIEFLPPTVASFVGPNPPDMKVSDDEENPAMRALLTRFARGVRTLRPAIGMNPVQRLEINMAWESLIGGELRAKLPIDAINVWDVFKHYIAGQRQILPHRHPLSRLVNWCYEHNVSLVGYEKEDAIKLVYPALHITDENCMLLADE